MTPPDSDAATCNATLGEDRVVYQCSRPKGHAGQHRDGNVTAWNQQPGSDAREVCGAVIASVNGDDVLRCDQQRGHDGAHYVKIGAFGGAREDEVLLSRSLAQRILAALDALAAELRERLPQEPK